MATKKKPSAAKKTRAVTAKSRAKPAPTPVTTSDSNSQFVTVMVVVFTVLSIVFLIAVMQQYL